MSIIKLLDCGNDTVVTVDLELGRGKHWDGEPDFEHEFRAQSRVVDRAGWEGCGAGFIWRSD